MSRCSSTNTGIVLLESKTRQIIYTTFVSMCSLTIGMCLEWAWCTVNIDDDNQNVHSKHEYQRQALNNLLYFGMIISAGPAAFVVSLLGLRSVLVIGLGLTTCGSIVIIYSTGTLLWLYIGRILHGLGAGIVFVVVPNYSLEIAEPKLRGMLTSFHYVYLLTGMLLSQVATKFFIYSYVNMITLIMSTLNMLMLLVISDPPYYRLKLEKQTNMLDYILKIQDFKRSSICKRVYTNIKDYGIENNIRLNLIFKQKQFRQPLLMNICLILIQQFCGFVSLSSKLECLYDMIYISEQIPARTAIICLQLLIGLYLIVKKTGYSSGKKLMVFMLFMAFICLYLVTVLGKRNLLMISGFGMAIALTLMNISYDKEIVDNDELVLFSLIVIYIIFYSIGYGPILWILMPELCPRKSRLWTSGFTVSLYAYLNIINSNQSFYDNLKFAYGLDIVLLSFTIISLSGGIFALILIPEKKDCNMV